jgi:hypothetical protein
MFTWMLALLFASLALTLMAEGGKSGHGILTLTRPVRSLHRRTLEMELPRGWSREGALFVGALMSFHGFGLIETVTIK